jgi:hypothetical protein
LGNVLGSQLDPRIIEHCRHLPQVRKRRANQHFDAALGRHSAEDTLNKRLVGRQAAIHLPVSSDEVSAHRHGFSQR